MAQIIQFPLTRVAELRIKLRQLQEQAKTDPKAAKLLKKVKKIIAS